MRPRESLIAAWIPCVEPIAWRLIVNERESVPLLRYSNSREGVSIPASLS